MPSRKTSKPLRPKAWAFVNAAKALYGDISLDRNMVAKVCKKNNLPKPWWFLQPAYRSDMRGFFDLPSDGFRREWVDDVRTSVIRDTSFDNGPPSPGEIVAGKREVPLKKTKTLGKVENSATIKCAIPSKFPNYVPFGHFKDVREIISSRKYFPIYVTGLSGNGKTLMVEEACARAKRELFVVPITIETDEDDLLGGFRLVDGETVWFDGPVIEAMKRGAVLLLDEIDLASNKILCLQPILAGSGVLLKKINEYVKPTPGFTIIATANTKGKGSEDGRFIGTNVLNEAFLERFVACFEQDYPKESVETKIVSAELISAGKEDSDFATKLVKWAALIRKSFYDGAIQDIIATRRLVHIAKAFGIFGDKLKAIKVCIARFDDDTKASFLELYTMVDAAVGGEEDAAESSNENLPEGEKKDSNE